MDFSSLGDQIGSVAIRACLRILSEGVDLYVLNSNRESRGRVGMDSPFSSLGNAGKIYRNAF